MLRIMLVRILFVVSLSWIISLGCNKETDLVSSPERLDFQPNILWLVVEDLSPIIPPFGDSTISTPALSRLAAEGVRYSHVFSPSGVCAPSRAAIALGMYQNHIGAHHMRTGGSPKYFPDGLEPYEAMPPAGVKMHSEYLREAGYYTTNNNKEDYQFSKPLTAWDESSRSAHWRNREPGQPFFAIFNFNVTHESQVWARAGDSLWVDENVDVPVPPYLPNNEVGRKDVRQVYSNIKQMDKLIGDLLAELDGDGLLDSTIVFWYSDHGGPLPRQKRLLYDSGMRVPLIVRYPNKWRAGQIDEQLISFIDFKPTLLSLVGIKPPSYVDGQAFLGIYASKTPRTYVHGAADRFDEEYDMIRAVRDQRFKYLRNFQPEIPYYLPVAYREQMAIMKELLRMRENEELDQYQAQWFRSVKDPEELFDTENDPHELQNLAADPFYSEKLMELRDEMDRWMQEIEDKGLLPEKEYIASIWPGGNQPITEPPAISRSGDHIMLSNNTKGASIGYQLLFEDEHPDPGSSWRVYTGPVMLTDGVKLVAHAHRIGFKPSEYVEAK